MGSEMNLIDDERIREIISSNDHLQDRDSRDICRILRGLLERNEMDRSTPKAAEPGGPCEYCGPVCYRGACHNARVEAGDKWGTFPGEVSASALPAVSGDGPAEPRDEDSPLLPSQGRVVATLRTTPATPTPDAPSGYPSMYRNSLLYENTADIPQPRKIQLTASRAFAKPDALRELPQLAVTPEDLLTAEMMCAADDELAPDRIGAWERLACRERQLREALARTRALTEALRKCERALTKLYPGDVEPDEAHAEEYMAVWNAVMGARKLLESL